MNEVILHGKQLEIQDAYELYEKLKIKIEKIDNNCIILSKEEA